MPDIGLSTDIIVGFPGETDADHADTLGLLREIRFDSAFMFAYSPRPGTAAAEMSDTLSAEIAQARLREVIDTQEEIGRERNCDQIGRVSTVLIEGPSKKRAQELFGRTPENRSVVLRGDGLRAGSIVDVRIVGAYAHTLRAELLPPAARTSIGDAPC